MNTTAKQTRRVSQERRLQAALRENLKRRKAQARGRQEAAQGETADQADSVGRNGEPPAQESDKS